MASLPFKVKAVHEYDSPHEDDLKFPTGQIIIVKEEEDADWYVGEYTDASGTKQEGLFPKNFVERYEPEAPPRPTRARPKKEAVPAIAPTEPDPSPASPILEAEPQPSDAIEPAPEPPAAALPPKPAQQKPTAAAPPAATKSAPPPVAEKPSSFKDRIAAFNKPSAQPLAPVKPGPLSGPSTNFIKKPFVAPPPSRDAYVPPPTREPAPQKVYRREEDPEIVERQAQDLEDAEKAGLVTSEGQEGEEEASKPTSLRDRIALLQKQQQEQASRRADVGQKDKPKRSSKKRTESDSQIASPVEDETVDPEQAATSESRPRESIDSTREVPKPPLGRRQSRDPRASTHEIISDGNEADQSGAGDTTEEAEAEETEVENSNERFRSNAPAPPPRTSTGSSRAPATTAPERLTEGDVEEEPDEEDEEEDEEEEMDGETRRKLELRERMAKMSGGMGMPGMFSMPMPGPAARKKQASGSSEQRAAADHEQIATSPPPTQRVPMVPVPGMSKVQSPGVAERQLEVDKEPEASVPLTSAREPGEIADVEDIEDRSSSGVPLESRAAPPVPQGKHQFFCSPQKARRDSRREALLKSRGILSAHHSGRSYSAYDGAPEMFLAPRGFKRSLPAAPPSGARAPPPPPPGSRPAQAAPNARAAPPPPPRPIQSPGPGSESDDEMPAQQSPVPAPPPSNTTDSSARGAAPPVPRTPNVPQRPEGPRPPPASAARPTSYVSEATVPTSPMSPGEKQPRAVPPIPSSAPTMLPGPATDVRPPPPPPPTAAPPTRQSTGLESTTSPNEELPDDGESEYEGDYDTDIAAGATHKNALTAHAREPSLDDSTLSEATPPPVPVVTRGVPPPLPPHQAPADARQSLDAPRAPPPAPPSNEAARSQEDAEYDPYRHENPMYGAVLPTHRKARIPNVPVQESDPAFYGGSPPQTERVPPAQPQSPPPQAQSGPSTTPARQSRDIPRHSLDVRRTSMNTVRKSTEQPRPSTDQGQMAQDIELSTDTLWWASSNTPPPIIQNRPDVLCEFEESSTSKRGGRTTISKDVYALFPDYSQTVVTARFDSKDPSDVSLEQRHEAPPPRLRQDQLEEAHAQFGQAIFAAAMSKQNQTIGNGTAQALVLELVRAQANALLPIGTRAYGALIYANMANATVQQYDEIRPGDVISFRNAKFSGKHGAMHAKYSEDVGKPEHVGIVTEWDGTKKKVRALEQGRESKKTKVESFRVGDLRSGEVKVWRVMGRNWIGWDSS